MDLISTSTKMHLIHIVVPYLLQRKISSTKSEGEDAESSRNTASAPPLPEDEDKAFGEKVPL